MVDYKASLVYAGAFAVGAALAIVVLFILTGDASRAGVAALSCVAFISGVQAGRWLVRHFELAERNEELDAAKASLESANSRIAGLREALDNERRKSAELAKRWEDLQAGERRKREAELRARRNFDADRLLLLTPRECVAIDKILRAKDGVECLQDGTDVEALIESHIIYEAENVSFDGMFYVGVEGTRMCAIERAELPYFSRYAQQVAEVAREYSAEALVRVADQIRRGIPGVEPLGDTRRTGETDHAEEVAG